MIIGGGNPIHSASKLSSSTHSRKETDSPQSNTIDPKSATKIHKGGSDVFVRNTEAATADPINMSSALVPRLTWRKPWHKTQILTTAQSLRTPAAGGPTHPLPEYAPQKSRMLIRCCTLGDGLGDPGVGRQFAIEMAHANPQNKVDLVIIAGANFESVRTAFLDNTPLPPNLGVHFMPAEHDRFTKDPIVPTSLSDDTPESPTRDLHDELRSEQDPIVLIDIPVPNPNYGFGATHSPTAEALEEDLAGWRVSHPSLYFRISEHGSHYCHAHNSLIGTEHGIPELISLGISPDRYDPSYGMIIPSPKERNVNELSCKDHPYIKTLFGDDLDMEEYHHSHLLTTTYGGPDLFFINIVALQCALAKENIATVDALVIGSAGEIHSKLTTARHSNLWKRLSVRNLMAVDQNGTPTSLATPDPSGKLTVRLFMHGIPNDDLAIVQSLAVQSLEKNRAIGIGGASGDSSLIELFGHAAEQAKKGEPSQLFPAMHMRLTEHMNNWDGLMQMAFRLRNPHLIDALGLLGGELAERRSTEQIKLLAASLQMPEVIRDFRQLLSSISAEQNPLRISWDIDKALVKLKEEDSRETGDDPFRQITSSHDPFIQNMLRENPWFFTLPTEHSKR